MDVVEAILGGAGSSLAILLCSKFSVNEGILLRDLVFTLGGAGEVIASFLDEVEPVVEFSEERHAAGLLRLHLDTGAANAKRGPAARGRAAW